nr:TetR/AcrR family transcriptional regulator [Leucobacter exalbidus]
MIADAAAHEFIARSYAGASLSAIAKRLGLTKGALTYHFRTKEDFATYFLAVSRAATSQADAFSRAEYPDSGSHRLLLYFMLMTHWRTQSLQHAAGMSLFGDKSSPIMGSELLIQEWLRLSQDAFEVCDAQHKLDPHISPLDAAEMLLLTSLGRSLFSRYARNNPPETRPLRFLRMSLAAAGIPDVEAHADEVLTRYAGLLPELE